jgi:hypothetical protein
MTPGCQACENTWDTVSRSATHPGCVDFTLIGGVRNSNLGTLCALLKRARTKKKTGCV